MTKTKIGTCVFPGKVQHDAAEKDGLVQVNPVIILPLITMRTGSIRWVNRWVSVILCSMIAVSEYSIEFQFLLLLKRISVVYIFGNYWEWFFIRIMMICVEFLTPRPSLLQLWSADHHLWHDLGSRRNYRITSPTSDTLDQNLHSNEISRWIICTLKPRNSALDCCRARKLWRILLGYRNIEVPLRI